jgi:anti-sigma B factor antagonist
MVVDENDPQGRLRIGRGSGCGETGSEAYITARRQRMISVSYEQFRRGTVSSSEWTPVVPGHTNEIRRTADEEQVPPADPGDAAAEQVIHLDVDRPSEDVMVVHVDGDIDTLTSPLLSSYLADQFATNPQVLVLDLTGVQFLGSAGLAALIMAREEAERRDTKLRLVSASHAVLRPLAATGLSGEFDVYESTAAALA